MESVPPVFVAVTVYVAEGESTVGVPVISPVEGSKVRPAGSAGEMLQEVAEPPVLVGVIVEIARSLVNEKGESE